MKKSLIAMAVLAAAGAAQAQSSVTMFGIVDIGYGQHKTTGPSNASIKSSGIMDGVNAGPRIGFRGSEDLGGGLKANFWVEQGINVTNDEMFAVRVTHAGHQVDGFSNAGSAAAVSGSAGGYGQATNRQSWVGISGGFGDVRLGWQYTNMYELATFGGYTMGSEGLQGADKAHLLGAAAAGGARANGITYISPSISGVVIRAQYGSGSAGRETVESSAVLAPTGLTMDNSKRMGIMAKYDAGPISAALAYTTNNVQQSARATAFTGINVFGSLLPATTTAITNTAERKGKLTQIGGSYDFKVAKIGLTHNMGDSGGSASSTVNSSYKSTNLSATVPFGKTVPFVSWGKATTTNDSTLAKTEDYKLMQFGVRHSLSPRTIVYAMSGTTKNTPTTAATYDKDTKTIVGVFHSF